MKEFEMYSLLAGKPITCHAFNKARTRVVVSSNSKEAYIFAKKGSDWELEHVLDEHDQRVTSVDWGDKRGNIVTCSQDRNAYVWKYDADKNVWKPDLVLLRTNRSATCVRFNGLENKFVVGTGANMIAVCYYDEVNDWWISRHIKKPLEGTVISVVWHPNNSIIAATCTDMNVYVFSARIKNIDTSNPGSSWGDDSVFGTLLFKCKSENRAWIHSIAFSPSGEAISWTSHDSTISYKPANSNTHCTEYTKLLPFRSLIFISDIILVAAGYDFILFVYSLSNGKISLLGTLGEISREKSMNSDTAFKIFKMLDSRAQQNDHTNDTLQTVHKNTISLVRPFEISQGLTTRISSTADDGTLVVWDVSKYTTTPVYAK